MRLSFAGHSESLLKVLGNRIHTGGLGGGGEIALFGWPLHTCIGLSNTRCPTGGGWGDLELPHLSNTRNLNLARLPNSATSASRGTSYRSTDAPIVSAITSIACIRETDGIIQSHRTNQALNYRSCKIDE